MATDIHTPPIKNILIHHMSPPKTIFIILSLIFIFMAIKGRTNVLAHKSAERKRRAQKQKPPLYYRTSTP